MSSNEEYLDNLLRSMEAKEESASEDILAEEPADEPDNAPLTLDEISEMSMEDISDMLNSINDTEVGEASGDTETDALLADALKDEAIQEINDLLYKNDNGEYVEPDEELDENTEKLSGEQPKKEKSSKDGKKGFFSKLGIGKKKEDVSVAEEEVPVIEEEIPVIEEEIPVIEEEVPAIEEEVPVIEEEVPVIEEEVPVIEEEIPAIEEEVPIVEQEIPISNAEEAPLAEGEATLNDLFGDFFMAPADEQQELRKEPEEPDLDEGLEELLAMAGVSESDFNGQPDGTAAEPVVDSVDEVQPTIEETSEETTEETTEETVEEELLGDTVVDGSSDEVAGLDSLFDTGLGDMGADLFDGAAPSQDNGSDIGDVDALMGLLGGDSESDSSSTDEEASTEDNNTTKKKKPKKEKKKTDDAGAAKKGLFAKLIDALTESDDEDEELSTKDSKSESDGLDGADAEGATTDENKEVNRQLDAEEEDKKNKKKKKKRKKGEPEGAEELEERPPREKNEDGEESDEDDSNGKKKKKKKEKKVKEKKEKTPKPADGRPLPKLPKKRVRLTFIFAFSCLAALIVCCFFLRNKLDVLSARTAYYSGDYNKCYSEMYGKKLSESDQMIFEKARMHLIIDRYTEKYDNYMAINDEYHAVDSLLRIVANKNELISNAAEYGLETEAIDAYNSVLALLEAEYGISEEKAEEINGIELDALYTIYINSIVDHVDFVIPEYLKDDYVTNKVNSIMNGEIDYQ